MCVCVHEGEVAFVFFTKKDFVCTKNQALYNEKKIPAGLPDIFFQRSELRLALVQDTHTHISCNMSLPHIFTKNDHELITVHVCSLCHGFLLRLANRINKIYQSLHGIAG